MDNFSSIDQKRKIKKVVSATRLTDVGNAERIVELFADSIRFDHLRKRWLTWEGHRWQPDADGQVSRFAVEAARTRFSEAANEPDLATRSAIAKWAIASEAKNRLDAATGILKSLKPVADSGKDWDSEPMLFSCLNGVVDLKTGKLRPGRPEDRITMRSEVAHDSEATCPRWLQFLDEIFESNQEMISYVHKALGYSMTGDTGEQVVFIGHGTGSNGKSVFFATIRDLLGDYSMNAPTSLFQRNPFATSSNDLAAIEFRRFLMCSEVLSSSKLNEQRIKQISGGDPITARYLYSEHFTFMPNAKIWLFLNHLPIIEDDSFAFWRRVRLLPFNVKFEKSTQDTQLAQKLKSEFSGILNWLIEGALLWQTEGLNQLPEVVRIATKEYQQENDVLAEFLDETCDEGEGLSVKSSMLFSTYNYWAENKKLTGQDKISFTDFGRRMGDKYPKIRGKTGVFYRGLDLKNSENDPKNSENDPKTDQNAPKSNENDQKTVIFEQSFLPKMTKNAQNDQIGVGLPGTSVGLRPFFSKPSHEEHFKIVLGKSGLTLHPGTKTLHQPYTQPRGNTELDITSIPGLEDLKL